jgi:hypothetical protein
MLRSCPPSFADGESGVRIREQQGRGEAKDVSARAEMIGIASAIGREEQA